MEWYQLFMIIIAMYAMHRENTKNLVGMKDEMKDFHGRLCALEEKYIQMMQRIMEKK